MRFTSDVDFLVDRLVGVADALRARGWSVRSVAEDGVLAVEDVIVHKLIAGRPRDRDDIASILATGVRLDEEYFVAQAASWDVDELWRAIRAGGAG